MSRSSAALNNLRVCAVVSVLAFHSVLAYLDYLPPTPFAFDHPPYRWTAFPMLDAQRFIGFDLFCGFQDVYLMSLMFFLSGVFVWPSIARKGEAAFLQGRFLRLCIPAGLVVLVLMPLAHYATYRVGAVDRGIEAFFNHWLALPFWPSGPPWFLWQLFVLNIAAAALCNVAPGWCKRLGQMSAAAGANPGRFFWVLLACSALAYVPLGTFNAVVALTIATIKAAIVAAIFMELRDRGPRTFVFAGAGMFWLGILLWLGLMDFLTRT